MTEEAQAITPAEEMQDPNPDELVQKIEDQPMTDDNLPAGEPRNEIEPPLSTESPETMDSIPDTESEEHPELVLTEIIPDGTGVNINMLVDIPVRVTAELGRTNMTVKQILELERGSVIELDRIAGDPIDLFVNDHLIARGEVVIVDDNFGIRITEIVASPPITGTL